MKNIILVSVLLACVALGLAMVAIAGASAPSGQFTGTGNPSAAPNAGSVPRRTARALRPATLPGR